jgi:hypothetical protein
LTDRRVRPRYARLAAASSALAITLVALLGGIGVFPTGSSAAAASRGAGPQATLATVTIPDLPTPSATAETDLPADSGTGKRVVFDMSDQRVWLVDDTDEVSSTYLVSGSVTDNLGPGTYAVYSRSRWAVGIDDSGVMEYFTRFTRGANAAIGFHSIPTKNGRPLQTQAQLGTPQSHGCIRQALPDAKRLWDFAPEGTKVVVTT